MASNSGKPDLNTLWEQHCYHEFVEHDAATTMETMIAEPYVNHVPTMTGGYGGKGLYEFYRDHFVSKVPADAKLMPISRTIGDTTLVDEFIFCCTHDREIDFMLPGVAPTGKYFEVPTYRVGVDPCGRDTVQNTTDLALILSKSLLPILKHSQRAGAKTLSTHSADCP